VKPLWFGSEERPLFGWLHVPESGQARGAVLLSPTLGIEAVSAHRAYRRLADRLAEAGFASLRFDYDGTGDSAGRSDDPGRVAAWLESIRMGVDLMRSLGLARTSVIGMRVGATLVAATFGAGPATIDDLVLWDPCASGRTFLREQGALWSFALGTRRNDDGSIETPGLVYEKDTVADLSSLAIANTDGPMAEGILVLMRSDRKGDRRMNERLEMPNVERKAIVGQEDLVDAEPAAAIVPDDTIELMVEWISTRAAASPTSIIDPDDVGRMRAIVATSPTGEPIDERPVSLGPLGLFGIVTSQCHSEGGIVALHDGPAPAQSFVEWRQPPTIVLLNAGLIDHVGPARLWVQLGRSWAGAGFRVVRFDLSGIGDSPVRMGQPGQVVYPPEALDDIRDVLRDVLPDDPSNAILVGLSSGGFHAVHDAMAHKVRGVCVMNPTLAFARSNLGADAPPRPQADPVETHGKQTVLKRMVRALLVHDWLDSALEHIPDSAWWLVNRIAVEPPPARKLSRVVDAGVDLFVIAGKEEARVLTRGEGRTMRLMRRTGRFHMEVIPVLEHTLFERHGRDLTIRLLTEYVLDSYGPSIPEN
jgi:alpha-beta hydrolase superfamily lysophospholipase